jgi:hypothetical protein
MGGRTQTNIPNASKEYFDVETLKDMDESSSNRFIDLKNREKEEQQAESQARLVLPKEKDDSFNKAKYKRIGNKIAFEFKIMPEEMAAVSTMTFGMFSPTTEVGQYEFDIQKNSSGAEEIYYFDEFVGELIDGSPRIYKRYFSAAIIRSMVKQDILYEYEKNKLTIHPLFLLKLKMNSYQVAKMLMDNGIATITIEDMDSMKDEEIA